MNETTTPSPAAGAPWTASDSCIRVPDTSMLPGSEKMPTPAVHLLNQAVQGAHHALDLLSDRAKPVAWQVGEKMSAAQHTLQATSAQLRQTGDAWTGSLRNQVRSKPLTALLLSALLGAVIARITHRR